jgi:predicted 3-demethylubiquinone-9 3-methyltransferase (glyoxalase superfamily)
MIKQRISPFLWFDNQAQEAAEFYVSIFPNSALGEVTRYAETGPGPNGSVMTVAFELDGQQFTALNGGPIFKFTEALSLVVNCESQKEVDYYWDRLLEGGGEAQCGWVKDKYGVSWQVVPIDFIRMVQDKDPAKVDRVMKAMMKMKRLDLAELERAYNG